MEGLEPEVYYEFYVVSINAYGKSEPSPRLIIRTLPPEPEDVYETKYNMSTCCQASGLLPQCAPLCTYNIRLSDIEKLGPACRAQMCKYIEKMYWRNKGIGGGYASSMLEMYSEVCVCFVKNFLTCTQYTSQKSGKKYIMKK